LDVAELLNRGIAAAKAGENDRARAALLKVIEQDERNEQAWLWLSGVVDSQEDRRICLENVLAINPNNTRAQAGLRLLEQAAPAPVEGPGRGGTRPGGQADLGRFGDQP
jgi:hypothetical protein